MHDGGERERGAERHDLTSRLPALLPQRARVAHSATVLSPASVVGRGAPVGTAVDPGHLGVGGRRDRSRAERVVASTCRGAASSSSVTERSWNRRADTRTRDSSEPTAWL